MSYNCMTNNSAHLYGGAISVCNGDSVYGSKAGTLSVKYANFTNNSATGGGAISVDHGGVATISCTKFTGNRADYGGAIIVDNSGTCNIDRTSFLSNAASTGIASAIFNEGAVNIGHSTAFEGSFPQIFHDDGAGGTLEFIACNCSQFPIIGHSIFPPQYHADGRCPSPCPTPAPISTPVVCAVLPPVVPPTLAPLVVIGAILGVLVLWGFYVMRHRSVLQRFSKKHARLVQKLMPPLTIGGALLSLVASACAFEGSLTALNTHPWRLYASVFGMTTGVFSLCYGAYCAREVYRAVHSGDEGRVLGGVSQYMREWFYVNKKDKRAALASDALIEHDFLEHFSHLTNNSEPRTEGSSLPQWSNLKWMPTTWVGQSTSLLQRAVSAKSGE